MGIDGRDDSAKAPVTIDERDRKDYFTPSCALFKDYCQCIVDRYGLRRGLVKQEAVRDIDYGVVARISEDSSLFTIRTDRSLHFARTVVLAVGAGNAPTIPKPFSPKLTAGACHAMRIQEFPARVVMDKIRARAETSVLVIGGGLTSAQVADMAIRHGVTKVWHIMRGSLKGKRLAFLYEQRTVLNVGVVKPFDVDLNWMGKFKNHEKATFWSADNDEGSNTLTPVWSTHCAGVETDGLTCSRTSIADQRGSWRRQHDTSFPPSAETTHCQGQALPSHSNNHLDTVLRSILGDMDHQHRPTNTQPTGL